MRRRLSVLGLALFVAAVGLGVATRGGGRDEAKPPRKAAQATYFQDVKPILEGRCVQCHTAGGIAPFSLTSYAQARGHRAAIAAAVEQKRMPPWDAAAGYRTYRFDPSLTPAQIETVVSWAGEGARRGDPAHPGRALESETPTLSRVDLRVRLPEPYTPDASGSTDDYRCFSVPWKTDRTRYVTGFDLRPGQPREVHHIIAFLIPAADAGRIDRWEAADARPGYECYGGPSATGEQLFGAQFLAGWAPGMRGTDLPEGTGIRVDPGSRLVVQVHYNLDHTKAVPDRSTLEFKLDDAVDKRGVYVPILNPTWVFAPATMAIPPGKRRVVHEWTGDPRPVLRFYAPGLDTSRGLLIHSVAHHMHELGVRGTLAVERADGTRSVLLHIPRWRFHWQRDYQLAKPAKVAPGDRLSIRCEWDNTSANQPHVHGMHRKPRLVTWGEDTTDEMCVGFVYATEP
jgi:mono/diheme cytochrome c family protein